jgi:hypothetical protein
MVFVEITNRMVQHVPRLADELPTVQALGISGSAARGEMDAYSDIDICVFVKDEYPTPAVRRKAYAAIGITDPFYFDVDFNTSRGDGFILEQLRCDFNWMVIENVRESLSGLETDFDSPEWLPGGLATIKAIQDPQNLIQQLQSEIPAYPVARSHHRVQQGLQEIHFSLYDLGWLPKAAHRGDTFSFLKYQFALLEKLFYVLFALNRAWYADEKRLTTRIINFDFVPDHAEERIRSTILPTKDDHNLGLCLHEIKTLCADTAQIARQQYPDLDLPVEWE